MAVRQALCVALIIVFMHSVGRTSEVNRVWHFSSNEIDAAYRYQERFGPRLKSPVKPNGCYLGQTEFTASSRGKQFLVPCEFLKQTIRHLKQMFESGAARYLFPLDADHAHLAVPAEQWREKYSLLPADERLPAALRDRALVALYHTAEHLATDDGQSSHQEEVLKNWRAKRNVLGFFDGRPVEILAPLAHDAGHDIPEHYTNVVTINFLAHRLGELVFSVNGKSISFDLSFEEDATVDVAGSIHME